MVLFYGREFVVVGEEMYLFSNVIEGMDVYFFWDFNDSSSFYLYKGFLFFIGGFNYIIIYLFLNKGLFNVIVKVYNVIS